MIKVVKDIGVIPDSLKPAFPDLFPERIGRNVIPVPLINRTTHARRMEAINAGFYTDDSNFNSRYKLGDIRLAIGDIYKGKCAFCEQNQEVMHVEHYRPKSAYYWLAYSWDNLLASCQTCNGNKGTKFELSGTMVTFTNSEVNIRNINSSSAVYDIAEMPKMVNPEITDPIGHIEFEKNGNIFSHEPRFKYTIESCGIDRKALNDSRKTILDLFCKYVRDAFLDNISEEDQKVAIRTNIKNFISDSKDEYQDFLAFRNYAIANDWLNDIVKEKN